MNSQGYDDGPTRGGKWGCAVAALIGGPLFLFLMLIDSLGDCPPDVDCGKGVWTHVVLPTMLVTIPVGLIIRWVVNRRG